MLKIKNNVDLKELEKFDYKKHGGTENCFYFYFYTKKIYGLLNSYLIKIDGYTRKIFIYKNLSRDLSFANVELITRNKKVKDLIKADMVEKVEE